MRGTYLTAIVIAVVIGLWLFSGTIGKEKTPLSPALATQNAQKSAELDDQTPSRVRARTIQSSNQTAEIIVRGRTENKRTVAVKAETQGRIINRPVERGDRVKAGDLLCLIDPAERPAARHEAREALSQAQINYEGSLKLKRRGLQSDTDIAATKARLASAQAQLKRAELELARTYVRAPFAGLIEEVSLEIGDFALPGSACATVVDLDPMLLVGRVTEKQVAQLSLGMTASGVLTTGESVSGPITFLGKQSDTATRTYAIEIQLDNAEFALRSGVTTEILLPTKSAMAHLVSPALLALDDNGLIGIRTVNEDNRVVFNLINIIKEGANGVWVTGLPPTTTLITVGQELVVHGEVVEVDYEAIEEMPAAAPEQGDQPRKEAAFVPAQVITATFYPEEPS